MRDLQLTGQAGKDQVIEAIGSWEEKHEKSFFIRKASHARVIFSIIAEIIQLENGTKGAYVDDPRSARKQSKGDSRDPSDKPNADGPLNASDPPTTVENFEAELFDEGVHLSLSPMQDGRVSCDLTPTRKRK